MRCWWWVGIIVPLATLSGCASHGGASGDESEHAEEGGVHVTVRVEPARLSALVESIEGLGRCEALPDHAAMLTPAVEGHVHALLVAEGQTVKKGRPIVELDQSVARADLAEKTATRDGLKASLDLLGAASE